jgi:hypothetical protein
MFCTAIVMAGGSWTISGVRARFHLLSTFLFQELDQVALDFTLTRLCWPPSVALGLAMDGTELGRHRQSLATIGGARPPSAELGLHRRRSASAELDRHLRRSATIGGAWPPSAALGRHRMSIAAFSGIQLPSGALGSLRRRSTSIGSAWPPSAALGRAAVCGAWPPSAALSSLRQRSATSGGPRPTPLGINYWVPLPGFPYCGTTIMVVPRAGVG